MLMSDYANFLDYIYTPKLSHLTLRIINFKKDYK